MKKNRKKTEQYRGAQVFLPRYEVTGVIGEGAAAVVYRAVDRRDKSLRAIKALKPESNAEPSVVDRFEEEYKILRGLHHPSLPEVYDYGFSDEGPGYMVMEYIVGERLDSYLKANPDDLWLLLYELNEVLTFIHEHGLLHQDLKPSNILVQRTAAYGAEKPLLMLMDFGLSRRRGTDQVVHLVGTPEYMAPEVIRGDGKLTRAVDYYSMGITLYELLAGETPFRGGIHDVFSGHLGREVRFTREKTEYADLYPHVLGLVAKDPKSRLEAFEDYRQAVAARIEGGVDELERAYGLGFISSIGSIGKDDAWGVVSRWLDDIDGFVRESVGVRDRGGAAAETTPNQAPRSDRGAEKERDGGDSSSFVRDLKQELLAKLPVASQTREARRAEHAAVRPGRVLFVSGASGSGKTYLFEDLRAQAVTSGRAVWVFGEKSEYEELAGDGKPSGRPDTLSRFIKGWDVLSAAAGARGAVLIVDGYEKLGNEEREFLEYVKKRIDLSAAEETDPAVFIAVSGTDPRLHQSLRGVIPEGEKLATLMLAHPQKADLENIAEKYRGRTVSLDFGKQLFLYLRECDSSAGAVVAGLKDALLKGIITFSRGQWQYASQRAVPAGRARTHEEYYRALLDGVEGDDRELLQWLSCHKGSVSVEDLARVSNMGVGQVLDAAAVLGPFRIIEVQGTGGGATVELSSESVRNALYTNVDAGFRKRAHTAYVELYESAVEEGLEGNARLGIYNRLSYHVEKMRDYERLFRVHLKMIDILRKESRVYEMREVCAKGISVVRKLRGKKWKRRRWHIERYYLKRWIEAEWNVNNYRGIRDIVRSKIRARKRMIPVGLALKCATAFDLARDCKEMNNIIDDLRKYTSAVSYVTMLILKAMVLRVEAEYEHSDKLLYEAEKHLELMNTFTKCRLYIGFIVNADRAGNMRALQTYLKKLEAISRNSIFINEYMVVMVARFYILFEDSKHQEARALIRQGVELAVKHKLYHRQRDWYLSSSAIYYEQGSYKRALKYAEKAFQLGKNLALTDFVSESLARMGMNYQNMGKYGDAIRVVMRAKHTLDRSGDKSIKIRVILFWFDLHLAVGDKKTTSIKKEIDASIIFLDNNINHGYYRFLCGQYYYQLGEIPKALESVQQSREIYEEISVIDDAVRAALLEGSLYLEQGQFEKAKYIIKYIRRKIDILASNNIIADYNILRLKYHYRKRSADSLLVLYLKKCEDSVKYAYEIKTLLEADKLLFRVKARMRRHKEAVRHFQDYYKKIKRVVANLQGDEATEAFLNDPDIKMIFKEYAVVKEKAR